MDIPDAITAISVLIAALSFAWGVSAWRREFTGKRRIELAEDVLASFYEAEDAIREIRSPFSLGGEGSSRKRSETETEEDSRLLDQAYVAVERYKTHEPLFARLRSMRYRFMATFGHGTGQPFSELISTLNEIFASARMLGTHYWRQQGRVTMTNEQLAKHLDQLERHEKVFWRVGVGDDPIDLRIRSAIEIIEAIAAQATAAKASWFRRNLSKRSPASTTTL